MKDIGKLLMKIEFGTCITIESDSNGLIYDGNIQHIRNSRLDILSLEEGISMVSVNNNGLIIKID